VQSRTCRICLMALVLAGLLSAGGCTRDRPLPTPTPTATAPAVPATPLPTAPPVITPDVPQVTYHTVQPGETLWDIANQYGVTVDALVAANELLNPDALEPGERLVIPQSEDTGGEASVTAGPTPGAQGDEGGQRTHTVAAGDTLWSIAVEYGTTVDEIARLNDLDPDAILTLGQELRIP
jgi:LysM repeat protein